MTQIKVHPDHPFARGPHLMGVVNVTPDSFSDGGRFFNPEKAIEHGLRLAEEGADILDIGGESSRPGSHPVDIEEEIRRVIPVVAGLKNHARWISIDTRNAATMEAALKAGANFINDISALTHDPRSLSVAAEAKVPVCLMHMQGNPQTMQENPIYNNAVEEIFQYLQQRIRIFETLRVDVKMLICDPGIGFGKTVEQNISIIGNIKRFHDLHVPILLGASRKNFIGKISGDEPPGDRIPGSLAAAIFGLSQGVQMFRVHDVKETRQAFKVYRALSSSL